jgi:hypothetical protein
LASGYPHSWFKVQGSKFKTKQQNKESCFCVSQKKKCKTTTKNKNKNSDFCGHASYEEVMVKPSSLYTGRRRGLTSVDIGVDEVVDLGVVVADIVEGGTHEPHQQVVHLIIRRAEQWGTYVRPLSKKMKLTMSQNRTLPCHKIT